VHPTLQGTLGVQAVIKDLLGRGYDVFSEVGNSARFDLVLSLDHKLFRVQVKSTYSKNGVASLSIRSHGKTKTWRYSADEIDLFALYVIDLDKIVYIRSKDACRSTCEYSVRFCIPKNGQKSSIHLAEDFNFGTLA